MEPVLNDDQQLSIKRITRWLCGYRYVGSLQISEITKNLFKELRRDYNGRNADQLTADKIANEIHELLLKAAKNDKTRVPGVEFLSRGISLTKMSFFRTLHSRMKRIKLEDSHNTLYLKVCKNNVNSWAYLLCALEKNDLEELKEKGYKIGYDYMTKDQTKSFQKLTKDLKRDSQVLIAIINSVLENGNIHELDRSSKSKIVKKFKKSKITKKAQPKRKSKVNRNYKEHEFDGSDEDVRSYEDIENNEDRRFIDNSNQYDNYEDDEDEYENYEEEYVESGDYDKDNEENNSIEYCRPTKKSKLEAPTSKKQNSRKRILEIDLTGPDSDD